MSGSHPPGGDSSGEPREAEPVQTEETPEAPSVEAGSPAAAGPDSPDEEPVPPESASAEGPAAPEADVASAPEPAGAPAEAQVVKVGDRVSGVVVRIGESDAFVDFGGRSEGVIPVDELKGEDGEVAFQPGDPIEAFIAGEDGEVLLSRFPSGEARQSDVLYKAFKSGQPVEGTVMAVNKWGLGVSVEGLRAFCPVSQIDTAFTEDPERFRNRTMAFRIIRFRDRGRNIVLSRRALLEAEQAKDAGSVRDRVAEGAELTGLVTRLESFGAFVDLGARVEGLIHVSELRHERVDHPKDVVQPGQEVQVKVIAVKSLGDRRKERISLSLKAMEKSPWAEGRESVPGGLGGHRQGRVPRGIRRLRRAGAQHQGAGARLRDGQPPGKPPS